MLFIYIVPQSNAYVIERLGVYKSTWKAGLHICIPFIDRVIRRISLKEQVADFLPQQIITKDNCTVLVDTVVFFKVTDPKLFTYEITDPVSAVANLTATTLRNYVGNLSLEEAMTSRDKINAHMNTVMGSATAPWGIDIKRVEIKDINPPSDVKEAMEKQIKAEREKRAKILMAEGQKAEAILQAEGEAEAMVKRANAKKETTIIEAEAEKRAKILKAEAEKQQRILKSEGEAAAIEKIQKARAAGIKAVNESNPTDKYLELQKYETFAKVGNGKATKIIIPSEIQNITGLAVSLKEATNDIPYNEENDIEDNENDEINENSY